MSRRSLVLKYYGGHRRRRDLHVPSNIMRPRPLGTDNRREHVQHTDQNSRTGRCVLSYHVKHRVEEARHIGCSERPTPAGRPVTRTPVGRYSGTISHNAAPSRSSALIAVWGSLMPGDRARTATSTSCRTANSRSAELTRWGPKAVAFRIASAPPPPEAPLPRSVRPGKYSPLAAPAALSKYHVCAQSASP